MSFKLVLRSVGETQSIYINGHPLAKSLKRDALGYEYLLSADLLLPGKNVVTIYAERFSDEGKKTQAFRWEDGGPAVVRVTVPAAQWKRSLFNGLAQVVVESTGEKGQIRLNATADRLAGSTSSV